jgi:hypothetical protein
MSLIDPARHADLIAAQRAVTAARAELDAYSAALPREVDDGQRGRLSELRSAVRDAAQAKDETLRRSGLVEAHDWYTADQALKQAAKS